MTKLRSIEIQVGRTGVLTPVAVFDPILLAGTIVSRAVLHNQQYITEKDINEENVTKILEAAGADVDESRVKALIAALEDVDIEEAMETTAMAAAPAAAAPAAEAAAEEEEEEEEEEEDEEQAAAAATAGLGALFG